MFLLLQCSILVNSLDFSKLRPNLPWLVDAGGCVILDSFVSFSPVLFYSEHQAVSSYLLILIMSKNIKTTLEMWLTEYDWPFTRYSLRSKIVGHSWQI
jgi:hypothetical protein